MEINASVECKKDSGDVIAADVTLYKENGDVDRTVTITESSLIEDFLERLETVEDKCVIIDDTAYPDIGGVELGSILENNRENTVINATLLSGYNSGDFAKLSDLPDDYSPQYHADKSNKYGVGSSTEYGHVKIRNNLTTASNVNGEALSAYQGKVLKDSLDSLTNEKDTLKQQYLKNSLRIKIGRASDNQGLNGRRIQIPYGKGDGIYAKLVCDDPSFELDDRTVVLVINGVPYERVTTSTGETPVLTINLNRGLYVLQAITGGKNSDDGDEGSMNNASELKIIEVI